jgi:hypothetical protein
MKGEKLHMRINLLSSFAAGILISTSVCGVVYFSDKGEVSKVFTNKTEKQIKIQPTENEMKSKLASRGYVVQTKAEYDKFVKDTKAETQKGTAAGDNEANKTVNRVVVNVTEGMTSLDVGHTLESAKLIPNAFNFSKDIENKGLVNKLHPGVYTVDSEMSYDQMVSTIFK